MAAQAITLTRFLIEDEIKHPEHGRELSRLLTQLTFASKIVARELARAALVGRLGLVGEVNPTGDAQQKLDLFAHATFTDAMVKSGLVSAVVSEELGEVKHLAGEGDARYVLCIDPLDGSSNLNVNRSVGTIFGVYRRVSAGPRNSADDVMRKGSEQVVAGYVLYGPSTIFIFTRGYGVNGFTLDRDLGEFLLSHENLTCPKRGHYYSANLEHYHHWQPNIQKFIDYATGDDPPTNRPYSLRYSGALVADFHACLIDGGVYLYPPDQEHPDGKLRLLYECAPLGWIAEQAGGKASNGSTRILDIRSQSIHQRTPLVIGSADEVTLYEKILSGAQP